MIKAFFEPTRIDEALRLRRELGDAAVFLAGGTEINAGYNPSPPENVISLGRLPFGRIEKLDGCWSIPASCTIQEILDTTGIPAVLAAGCRNIVNRNVRNMATIGGHVASNKSCSDIIPALLVLESKVEATIIADGSERKFELLELVEGQAPPLLIRKVVVPGASGGRFAVESYTRSSNDISIITCSVGMADVGGRLEAPRVAVGGVAPHPVRLAALEKALHGGPVPAVDVVREKVSEEVSPISDLRGSEKLKRHLAGVLVARALHRAANGGDVR